MGARRETASGFILRAPVEELHAEVTASVHFQRFALADVRRDESKTRKSRSKPAASYQPARAVMLPVVKLVVR